MKTIIIILSWLSVLFTLIPFVKRDAWWIRVFDYPKIQFTVFSIVCLFLCFLFIGFNTPHEWFLLLSMLTCILYHGYIIVPYTYFFPKQSLNCDSREEHNSISLLIFNVYMYNKKSDEFLQLVKENQPDLILLVETDNWWKQQVEVLDQNYPFKMEYPVDNTYGMLLFSKYVLTDSHINFLVEENIPSFHTKIELPSKQMVQFYGLHPKPPVPGESLQSTERDAELLLIGKKVRHQEMPVIVAGDLNDVAWSYTSKLFLRISELLDPRIGRGFYNSFHAQYPMFRCPLDHVFHSNHFKLLTLKRLYRCGSDHFPIFIQLCYQKEAPEQQDTPAADKADIILAKQKINAI
ncbi:MAG: endonuclease/exonuclease/phosphatase family protein [Chitinophagales bacterium]